MRKLLIVGCGGSGGATLSYMMDQLLSDLADHGIDKIPAGWQFVHVDVPISPDEGKNVKSVPEMGGVYSGVGPQGDSYSVLDSGLSQGLVASGALAEFATWAPRNPESVTVPISVGAGQYRAIGRAITLSRINKVYADLQRAWGQLYDSQTNPEMRALSLPGAGGFDPGDDPIVLVVSSMAGGAGASMALDVCRILTLIPGVNPDLMGVFMVTPDIFGDENHPSFSGTRPNALAMLGEIIASQTGAARAHDVTIMRALGHQNGAGSVTPFKRVFPVGAHVGNERTLFGDGSQGSVYRGLGRGLAALIQSGSAMQDFVAYDLGNGRHLEAAPEFLAWGADNSDNVPWGAFGYASISMGRDRYAEYAAQRLARSSADLLLSGHLNPNDPASAEEQVSGRLDVQWSNICARLGLPDSQGLQSGVGSWVWSTVLPQDQVNARARAIVNSIVRPRIDQTPGVNGQQWAGSVSRVLAEQRDQLLRAASEAAYGVAFSWAGRFDGALQQITTEAVAEIGLPYASGLVKRASRTMQAILPGAQQLTSFVPTDVAEPSPELARTMASLKGAVNNPAALTEQVLDSVSAALTGHIYAALAHNISDFAGASVSELFDPLIAALDEAQTVLRDAADRQRAHVALADLRTDEYAAWPADTDARVADRFSEADNEVMLTSSDNFQGQYQADLPASVDQGLGAQAFETGRRIAIREVVTGWWETVSGTQPPGAVLPTVERLGPWSSRAFPRNPETGETINGSPARFDVHVRPSELLSRSRQFVGRPGRSFDRYVSQSLQDYVTGRSGSVDQGVPESELARRQHDLIGRFAQAVQLARPLASVNLNALKIMHNNADLEYTFKFSAVPFQHLVVADTLRSELTGTQHVGIETVNAFTSALTDESGIKRIDIFGNFPNYSPLVYESVGQPASKQWLSASPKERDSFWRYRRTRPLAASLPMPAAERRAMVAGWLLGRALGFIRMPEPPLFDRAVQVWDKSQTRWVSFPHPLLTPQGKHHGEFDWLPAVLESSLLAIASAHQPPVMESMHPYRALRQIFDAGPLEPTPINNRAHLSAVANIAEWLRTGESSTGVAPGLKNTGPGVSIEDRAAELRKYLEAYRGFASTNFMATGAGIEDGLPPAPGGGTFADITSRAQASATPIFRDLAPDVVWATQQIVALLDLAVDQAHRPITASGPIVPNAQQQTWDAPRPVDGLEGLL
ncbi:Tubulin like [Gordonia malaquae]|uniref:Tubulin-like protein n=1 Tax=Gordonia malaquae NBRC 108250 TaxID=1223542 RepID=M3UXC7_GORML|nr:tubulin-like doman-containing protein [Gordonia malaquae]GAC80387.1 hypothetical protein GM1_017_00450 [Gordonia malaquae NBRC 108250]SEB52484.1 Tubulin like [Gordonia malaquae]